MAGILTQVAFGVRAVVRKWERVQVELHGSYSVERFVGLQNYRKSTGVCCSFMALVAIPVFPLLCVAVVDALPLSSPDLGLAHSATLWIRGVLVGFLVSYALVWMLSRYVLELKLTKLELFLTTIAADAAIHVTALGFMLLLWYPLPFTLFWTTGPWLGTLAVSLKLMRGEFLSKHPEVQSEVRRFSAILILTTSTAVVYTAFNIIFQTVSTKWQTLVALAIPVLKIAQKNLFCRLLSGKDDLKSETVTLNVEVANALFISSTMQSLQSCNTSAMLIVLDFVQMLTSLGDVRAMLKEIRDITNEEPEQAIARAVTIASKYPGLAKQNELSGPSKAEVFRVSTAAITTNAIVKFSSRAQVSPHPVGNNLGVVPTPPLLSDKGVAGVSSRTIEKRHLLLQKVLRVMFFMEFFLLSEFMKALTPLMYSCYLVILYYWPNRRFYSQLEGLDDDRFWYAIGHIQIYGVLEAVLFVGLIFTLHKMAYKSPSQQLAYTVNRNWGTIQCKLVIWLLVLVHSTIPQLGTDFTFRFQWLRNR